jgi:hypothetical protein
MLNGDTGGPFPCTGNFTFPLTGSSVGGDRFGGSATTQFVDAWHASSPYLPYLHVSYVAKPAAFDKPAQ